MRKAASVAYAESGPSAPELMALFGWTNFKTAQIYIEKAEKRRMRTNAFERKAAYEKRSSVPLFEPKMANETNRSRDRRQRQVRRRPPSTCGRLG
ncbi:hypothetical protein HGP16_26510 [Rhizobium sp. P40RR-XXII]|uniref:hypothetical protein n=1 Tax=Rhizobium sp. P40RR-XXII TaxID=2726739 RepID=UPI00145746E3|nr:hypothetical protein [Rhizobium sp. P40RR-XXII]